MNEDLKNHRAWAMLDEALFVSSHVKKEEREAGETDLENVYPVSLEETDRMEELVEKAKKAADDPQDERFRERVEELTDIVKYSRKRHRTWKWQIIAGALIAAAVFWYFKGEKDDALNEAQQEMEMVKNWTESDTTIAYNACKTNVNYYKVLYKSAVDWKQYKLSSLKSRRETSLSYEKDYRQKADTAKMEKNKKAYLRNADESAQRAANYLKEYETMNKMDFKEVKQKALDEAERRVNYKSSSRNSTLLWTIFLSILIPLYIISGYSYGYVITSHRKQQRLLDRIQRWGFAIGGFFFGAGFAMSLLPDNEVTTHYSDGTTTKHTEGNVGNIVLIALKVGLMIAGAFIFSFVCVLIMTVQTISGLKTNFNWKPLLDKMKKQKVETPQA